MQVPSSSSYKNKNDSTSLKDHIPEGRIIQYKYLLLVIYFYLGLLLQIILPSKMR